jgi:hypothetical protein
LGIKEYWILDVQRLTILAFAIANNGSYRIRTSQVFAELEFSLLEETLHRSQQSDHGTAQTWLLQQLL